MVKSSGQAKFLGAGRKAGLCGRRIARIRMEPTIFTPKELKLVKVTIMIDPKTRNKVLGNLGNFLVAINKKIIPIMPTARVVRFVWPI